MANCACALVPRVRFGIGDFGRGGAQAVAVAAVAIAGMAAGAERVWATVPNYQMVGQFALPNGAWTIGNDGVVYGVEGVNVVRASAVNGSAYQALGSLPAGSVSAFGAAFISLSADGARVAIGDGNFGPASNVYFVERAALTNGGATGPAAMVARNGYAGAWSAGGEFFFSGAVGADSVVTRVTFAGGLSSANAQTVITGVGGASGGVYALSSGPEGTTVLVGAGFAGNGAATGEVRRFVVPIGAAASVGFLSGTPATTILSANSIDVDAFGNLLVGGADYAQFPDVMGFAAVVDGLSGPAALMLAPAGPGAYDVRFNPVTQEVIVASGGVAYRYAVPGPGGIAVGMMGMGLAARRRRRGAVAAGRARGVS